MFPQFYLIALYFNIFSPFSYLTVRQQVPQPCKKAKYQFSMYVLIQKTEKQKILIRTEARIPRIYKA